MPGDLRAVLDEAGFLALPIETRHAWAVRDLPRGDHKDPFDRQLVAQALLEDLPVSSRDDALDQYGIERRS